MNTFVQDSKGYLVIPVHMEKEETCLTRTFDPLPFVPSDEARRNHRCNEILSIQSFGLKKDMSIPEPKPRWWGFPVGWIPRWRCW